MIKSGTINDCARSICKRENTKIHHVVNRQNKTIGIKRVHFNHLIRVGDEDSRVIYYNSQARPLNEEKCPVHKTVRGTRRTLTNTRTIRHRNQCDEETFILALKIVSCTSNYSISLIRSEKYRRSFNDIFSSQIFVNKHNK